GTFSLTPDVGRYKITAIYDGDGSFLPSTSAPMSFFVADYAISTNTTTFDLHRGESISIPITITPSDAAYNPTVTLGCYGLPTEAPCTFTPAQVVPSGGPAVATFVLATSAVRSGIRPHTARPGALYAMLTWGLPGMLILLGRGNHKLRKCRNTVLLALLLSLL